MPKNQSIILNKHTLYIYKGITGMFMSFYQNISFGGYNPFMMGCFNPRLNFFLGLAAGTAGIPYYPVMPSFCGYSIFNSYMPMPYANPYLMSGFGGYGSEIQTPQTFQYNPQTSTSNPFAFPSVTSVNQGITTTSKPSDDDTFSVPTYEIGQYTPSCSSVKSKAFLNKVKEIARRINCNYKDLLGVMQSESGLNPQAVNKSSGATGLIQFMPGTAKELGTTTSALKNMSAVQQLDYVEKYLQKMKKSAGFGQMEPLSGGQLYALIFLPARAHREILTDSSEKYYTANKGLDKNKDGKITKSELDVRIKKFYVNENCFVA